MLSSSTGISQLGLKATGKKRRAALSRVTIFSVQERIQWEIVYWVLVLGGEAGAVCGNSIPMDN